ncbi:phosphorylase, partial [Anaplasma marginale]
MNQQKIILPPNSLKDKVKETTAKAISTGALQSIPTDYEIVRENQIDFLVRVLTNLVRKDVAKKAQKKDFNPFLPYEKDLFVADLTETHLCLLNKYNVVDNHLLIVTRAFVEQETLLDLADFIALWTTLAQVDGLAFYNAGKDAGASVKHKHL